MDEPTNETRPAANVQLRLIADCPNCQHEQTEPFTEGLPLKIGEAFPCWNCGQPMVVSPDAAAKAAIRYGFGLP